MILLHTLQELGVSGSALSLLTSYLKDRTYRVTWRGSESDPCQLTTGVPQGSVLGPLLFSLYTNSLGSVISPHGFSYHCWRHPIHSVLSPLRDSGRRTHLCLSSWHLSVDVCSPPQAQPWQGWTAFPSGKRLSHSWPNNQHWHLYCFPDIDCKESGCDPR